MTILPLETLLSALRNHPCDEHWDRVQEEWPDGIPLHESTFVVADVLGLDLVWLNNQLDIYDERVEAAWDAHCVLFCNHYENYAAGKINWEQFQAASDATRQPYCDLRNAAILARLRTLVKP
jgi:hypothetical protein